MTLLHQLLAVVIAAIAGFLRGLGLVHDLRQGLAGTHSARGKKTATTSPSPFVIAAVACLVMACMLAGLMGHLADVNRHRRRHQRRSSSGSASC